LIRSFAASSAAALCFRSIGVRHGAACFLEGIPKLSLVSCPIALFPATSEREKISFHQLNKKTGHRINTAR
jgi:hypothetical protein